MRIAIVGGGPGGLLFATLAARNVPGATVDLFERNAATDAFGFGVVFSSATQRGVDEADSALRTTLDAHGVRWDAVEVQREGQTFSFAGNGMGAVLRKDLLGNMQREAASAGAILHFETPVELTDLDEYDVIVASDGANSRSRALIGEDTLGVTYAVASAKFIWFATPHPFDGLTFVHRHQETIDGESGVFAAHAYPIGKGLSTFIVETDEATWRAAGLDGFDLSTPPGPSDVHSQHELERIFAPAIGGAPLVGNSSRWGNFRTIRARSWHRGRVVFIGDAVHTAHFSVGSGTKMALEDAIALAGALADDPDDIESAFLAYESVRQPQVARIQDVARPSLSWWEHFGEYYHQLAPWQFAFHFFSRSLPISKIQRRDPSVVADARAHWIAEHGAAALHSPLQVTDVDGVAHQIDARLVDRDTLPALATVEVADHERDLANVVSTAIAAAPEPRSFLLRGGTRLTRQLVAEGLRLQHGRVAVVEDPEADDDVAETLVLSGRADAVTR